MSGLVQGPFLNKSRTSQSHPKAGKPQDGFPAAHGIHLLLTERQWLLPSPQTGVTGQLWEPSLHSPFWESTEFHDPCGISTSGLSGILQTSTNPSTPLSHPSLPHGRPVCLSRFKQSLEIPNFSCSVNPQSVEPLCNPILIKARR